MWELASPYFGQEVLFTFLVPSDILNAISNIKYVVND